MQSLAFTTGSIAFAVALYVALTGAGNRRDRIERFLIPSPLFIGAPICGLVLSIPQVSTVIAVVNIATILATVALVPLLVMVVALAWPTRPCK